MSVGGRGGVFLGTIWADTRIEGQAQTQQQLQNLTKTAADTSQGFEKLNGIVLGMVTSYISMQAAIQGVRTAYRAWIEYAAQETSINRVVVAMKELGMNTGRAREELNKYGTEFLKQGQREEAAWSSYRRLVQATHDRAKAQELLNLSLAFGVRQDVDAETVATALAKAWTGQYKNLDMLLSQYGEASKEAKTFAEAQAMVQRLSEGSADVMGQETTQLNKMKAGWDNVKDSASAAYGPIILTTLKAVNGYLEAGVRHSQNLWDIQVKLARWWSGKGFTLPQGEYVSYWDMIMRDFPTKPKDRKTPGEKPPFDELGFKVWEAQQARDYIYRPQEEDLTIFDPELLKRYEADIKRIQAEWDTAHAQMFDAAQTFSSGVADMLYDMVMGGEMSFEKLARYWESMLLRMGLDLLQSEIYNWLGSAIRGGKFGGGARPYEYGGDVTAGGLGGGYTPIGPPTLPGSSRGLTVVIPATTLLDAFNGSTVKVQNGLSVRIVTKGYNSLSGLS